MAVSVKRWLVLAAVSLLICHIGSIAADDTGVAKNTKGHEGGPPPDLNAIEAISNKQMLDILHAFCGSSNTAISEVGTGPVRFLLIGGTTIPNAEALLKLSMQTLEGFELWSGQQEIFLRKHPSDTDVFYIGVMQNDGIYNNFCDFLSQHTTSSQGGDPALNKKCAGTSFPRLTVVKESGFDPARENYAVYAAGCLSIDAYYLSKGKKAPSWIREGMVAQMQRMLCSNIVRCTTISYEVGSGATAVNWPSEVASMIKQNDQMLLPALSVMRKDVNAISGAHYRQLWSLFTLFQQNFDNKKGLDNRFYRLLAATQQGTDSETAVKNIFGLKDPSLTEAWHEWALTFKN